MSSRQVSAAVVALVVLVTLMLVVSGCGAASTTTTEAGALTTVPESTTTTTEARAVTTVPEPATTTTVGLDLTILTITSPVSPNSEVTLEAKTEPRAACVITVYYSSGASEAAGLEPKKADEQGRVSWTWKVGPKTTPGDYQVTVSASAGEKSGVQEATLTVTP